MTMLLTSGCTEQHVVCCNTSVITVIIALRICPSCGHMHRYTVSHSNRINPCTLIHFSRHHRIGQINRHVSICFNQANLHSIIPTSQTILHHISPSNLGTSIHFSPTNCGTSIHLNPINRHTNLNTDTIDFCTNSFFNPISPHSTKLTSQIFRRTNLNDFNPSTHSTMNLKPNPISPYSTMLIRQTNPQRINQINPRSTIHLNQVNPSHVDAICVGSPPTTQSTSPRT